MLLLVRLNRAEEIQPMRIDATKIAAAQGDAVAVEELEDLNRHLSPVQHPVTELRGRELPVGCVSAKILNDTDHFGDRLAQEEVVVRHLIELPEAAEQLAKASDFLLRSANQAGDVTHAGGTETLLAAQKRPDRPPQTLLVCVEANLMPGEPHP